MRNQIKCSWMSLELNSPYVMGSITLMSSVNLSAHINYYKKICALGAGAVVLPSVNPKAHNYADNNSSFVESLMIDTGLNHNKMGFALLGPTSPNIISLEYGIELASRLKREVRDTPILASIANLGNDNEIIKAVYQISKTGIDGIELNFSCPNIKIKSKQDNNLTIKLLSEIRKITKLPISLKLTPFDDYSTIMNSLDGEIDGLTLSNAYIGLIPPRLNNTHYSPFKLKENWAPCGVYGPFEKPLTFYRLYSYYEIAKTKNLSVACTGGIVSSEDAIQSILLGADVVQFSSAIAWNGVDFFLESNTFLMNYLKENNYYDINSIKGTAIPYIKQNVDELQISSTGRKMKVNPQKCKKCSRCSCCNRLCIAISQNTNGTVIINNDLCNGCGWCYYMCKHGAIVEDDSS